jgi:hypothetical protein
LLWVLLGLAVVGGGIYLAYKKGWIKFGTGNSDVPNLTDALTENTANLVSNVPTENIVNQVSNQTSQIANQFTPPTI